jgi:hypothetical protein
MATKTVTVSDITGKDIPRDDAVILIVREHPEVDHAVKLDVGYSEVAPLRKDTPILVYVEVIRDGQEPEKMVVNMSAFERIIRSDVVAGAEPAARSTSNGRRSNEERIDYRTIENAGRPHRGKLTDKEKSVIRENLDQVNANLRAAGVREIDLNNPEHVEKYGLHDLVEEPEALAS